MDLPKTNDHKGEIEKLHVSIPVNGIYSFFQFSNHGKIQKLLHAIKYHSKPSLCKSIGIWYGKELLEVLLNESIDLIIPVPLHPRRLKERGYNQSAEFGKGLSESLSVPFNQTCVERVRYTSTQTRKSKVNRIANMTEVFKVVDQSKLENKRIILVDDVITTGATITSLGERVLQAGAQTLFFVSIARA